MAGTRPAMTKKACFVVRARARFLPKPAVAVLVLLARAARAHLVAPDLAPGGGVLRIALLRGAVAVSDQRGRERRVRIAELVFAGRRIDLVRLHVRQVLLL